MKKNLLSLVFLLWVFTCDAQIELKINPIGALYSNPTLSVDFRFSEYISIEPSVGLSYRDSYLSTDDFNSKGRNYRVNGKFYFKPNKGHDGLYAGIYGRGEHIDFTGKGDKSSTSYTRDFTAAGFSFGYKLVSKQNIVFDFGLGIGRKINFNESNLTSTSTDPQVIEIRSFESDFYDSFMRLAIGYRFGGKSK
jgi:Protein of unknown function (DUF3575)